MKFFSYFDKSSSYIMVAKLQPSSGSVKCGKGLKVMCDNINHTNHY